MSAFFLCWGSLLVVGLCGCGGHGGLAGRLTSSLSFAFANAGNFVQVGKGLERAVLGPVVDDGLCLTSPMPFRVISSSLVAVLTFTAAKATVIDAKNAATMARFYSWGFLCCWRVKVES